MDTGANLLSFSSKYALEKTGSLTLKKKFLSERCALAGARVRVLCLIVAGCKHGASNTALLPANWGSGCCDIICGIEDCVP